ncbi:MAG: hypothetical protein AB7G93_00070 [Bdellovibrionales bacterium]
MNQPIIQNQIREIVDFEIPDLLERLPANGYYEDDFKQVGEKWTFRFTFASPSAHFHASGMGTTPREAFLIAKQVLLRQVREWHRVRKMDLDYGAPQTGLSSPESRVPIVTIMDDDLDTALAAELLFKQLGCQTRVVGEPAEMPRKLSFEETDLIVLDWKLGETVRGSDVIERANRLIDAFSDLRGRFGQTRPKIVTHSVLGVNEIQMPPSGYFHHLDHWQKPLPFAELVARGTNALTACGF